MFQKLRFWERGNFPSQIYELFGHLQSLCRVASNFLKKFEERTNFFHFYREENFIWYIDTQFYV